MAKCAVCDSRKGKRKCSVSNGLVCSLCCGTTRKEDLCSSCSFYQKPKRKYNDVPSYTTSEMSGNIELENYGNAIEGALCSYDIENGNYLKDDQAIKIIELLIDRYHFCDRKIDTDNKFIYDGVVYVNDAIEKDLSGVSDVTIVKVLGVIRFVAKRRTKTGTEYMNVIHQYVGQRIGTGMRVIRQLES